MYTDGVVFKGIKILEEHDEELVVEDEVILYTKVLKDLELINFEEIISSYSDFLDEKEMYDINSRFKEVITRTALVAGKEGKVRVEADGNKLFFISKSAHAKSRDTVKMEKEITEFDCIMNVLELKRLLMDMNKINFAVGDIDITFIAKKENQIKLLNNLED